jgi:predicted nucleic acid-binding protein
MSDYVADSSVAAKWVLPEPDSDRAERFGLDVLTSGGRLIILDLALVEVANALWKQIHRGRLTREEMVAQFRFLSMRPLHIVSAQPHIEHALGIAARYDLPVYDSLFVALTTELEIGGVTADAPLFSAVKADYPKIILLRDWPAAAS